MTEQRTSVIEVGDVISGARGERYTVESVDAGKFGLFIQGAHCQTGNGGYAYAPYELSAGPIVKPWYGWPARGTLTVNDDLQLGCVGFDYLPFGGVSALEQEWERTIDAMRSEEMQSRPTEIRMGD